MTKVFTAGEVLTAADVNTYLVNTTGSGNAIINGAFEINQRGFTSANSTGALAIYGFDRWRATGQDGTVTYSSQSFSPGAAPVVGYEASNHARVLTSGQAASNSIGLLGQPIEDVRSFANQTITISFWAKAASGAPKIAVEVDQQFGSGGSTGVRTLAGQVTLSTSWARYSISVLVPSISGKTLGASSALALNLWVSAGSDFNARTGSLGIQSNTFDIWGVQLEAGTVATPFRRNADSLQGELAACQRYYQRHTMPVSFGVICLGYGTSTTQAYFVVPLNQQMRVSPTSVEFTNLAVGLRGVSNTSITALTLAEAAPNATGLLATVASGLTANRPYQLENLSGQIGYVGFSAEL